MACILPLLGFASTAIARPLIIINRYNLSPPPMALVYINPANHQEFESPPPLVEVGFSQAIVPEKSELQVFDAYNNPVGVPKATPKDTRMSVALPERLLAGGYRIEWKAMCACQGNTAISGTSYFTVY